MTLSRMELDMIGSPVGLVTRIYKLDPTISTPVPVEEIAFKLDIEKIQELETDGFEGGLLTTPERTSGIILVKKIDSSSVSAVRRRRFTIAHELGHFLIPSHQPVGEEFLCSSEDMRSWESKDQNNYKRQEAEANEFAALLLMPRPRIRTFLQGKKKVSVNDIIELSEHFDVSISAAARNYIDTQGEPLAIVFVHHKRILWSYKSSDFPWITAKNGVEVPRTSNYHHDTRESCMNRCISETWVDSKRVKIYEDVYKQGNGYAMILLHAELPDYDDERDPEAEMTSAERYKLRTQRF